MKTIKTTYKQNFLQWLNNEHECQKLALSDTFDWQWFITMTSKDTMTRNGARLAMNRFLALYLQESKTDEVQCLWVAEPHNQGKNGYHIHALLQTKWPVPKERARELNLALMLDDIYQRAMGLSPYLMTKETKYLDKQGKFTQKHRFRAERYSKARGKYCIKYITKERDCDWEFARVTQACLDVTSATDFTSNSDLEDPKDLKGNWEKKHARMRTKALKRAMELRKGERIYQLNSLVRQAELNWAKFSKLRSSSYELETEYTFTPSKGVIVF